MPVFRLLFLSGLLVTQQVLAQSLTLSEPVTNNAVVALQKNGRTMFYSFFGLDSTKKWSGVHSKIFRHDINKKKSVKIGTLPDVGRLASAASVIDNKAYIVGGYTVMENDKEKSSDHLFIFDPKTESITKGATLPLRIDDQVQGVWRNKLLYVISGWSDSLNVNAVQVYDPKKDSWLMATPLPEKLDAKVFGGCGLIAGDTIYVLGGATYGKFYPPSKSFYKGVIDVNNPLHITWSHEGTYPGEHRYRSAAFQRGSKMYFIGGSNETYNYNGISYAEKKPVEPNRNILVYDQLTGKFIVQENNTDIMDLRGIVRSANGKVFTMGGMEGNQRVSNKILELPVE